MSHLSSGGPFYVSVCLVCIRDLVLVKMSVVSGLFYTCVARLVCNWVLVLVRMSHLSTAACQDVPYFVRWPVLCVSICLLLFVYIL